MITDISQLDRNKKYSYADYLTWRFKETVELIKGRLFILSPAPASRHQKIASNLVTELSSFFKSHKCHLFFAPFDVRLVKNMSSDNEITTVVQPDICVICDGSKIDERGCLGAPDLIVEILSPYTAKKDMNEKFNLYEDNGVQEYWVVFPDTNAINQYFLKDGKYEFIDPLFVGQTITSTAFPELSIELKDVFRN
ncbi:Uma2 family endonuclease [Niabella insulamsoli]|uniref:Uma2 family endonuclease n=1 Tax=Niabella insulamsoli TaxID=3144874 RepID=UPI0031FE3951